MKTVSFPKIFWLSVVAVGVFIACGAQAVAQDYFRELLTPAQTEQVLPIASPELNTDLAQTPRILLNDEDKYNLALGAWRFSASAGLGTEWTDNVALSSTNRQSDFIITPNLNIDAKWRITEENTLHFSIGMGYAYYVEHTQYNSGGFTLTPNSELAFTVHVGDFAITVRDQFSLMNDPISLIGLSNGAGNFQRFSNQAGISTDWAVNSEWNINVAFSQYNFWVLNSDIQSDGVENQSIQTVSVAPSYKMGPGFSVGLNMSNSWLSYSGSGGTADSAMVGPFVNISLTRSTQINLGVGYQQFNSSGGVSSWNAGDSNSIYASLYISNRLNEYYSQRFAFSHSTEAGYTESSYELYDAEYAANWRFSPSMALIGRLIYQHYDTSEPTSQTGNRYGAEIGTSYQLTPAVSLGLSYRYWNNNENVPGNNYYQDSVFFNVFYSF